jgi:hypothetical protein
MTYTQDEVIKIGNKYYLATDVQSVLDQRITSISPDEIEDD